MEEIMVSNKEERIKINISTVRNFLGNKKVQIALTVIFFLIILINSVSIRLSGLPNLIDQTTGKYVFADPDAFYEYRVAETIVSGQEISGIDLMRSPGLDLTYTQEMLPKILAFAYKIIHPINSSITLDYIAAIYPVVAFALSLVFFFILCWYLSKSKLFAILASLMLAYSPLYLQRTGVGISSHEALGMVFFFLALLVYAVSIENHKKNWKWVGLLGIATGISLALSLFAWAGASNFVLMIFSVFMLAYYLFGIGNDEVEAKKKFVVFNITWMVVSVIVMPLFGYGFNEMISRILSNYGILAPFAVVLMALDLSFDKYSNKIKIGQGKYRILYSIIGTLVIGFLGLWIISGKSPLNLISGIYSQLFHPLGQERVSLTVAYFAQPYLTDLMNSISRSVFWLFLLGIIFVGIELGKNISSRRNKIYFYLIWIFAVCGMLFSRYSASSIFNGTSFISKAFYLLSFAALGFYLIWLYLNDRFIANHRVIFLFSWMLIMLMSIRSAIRIMFVIITFVFVMVSFSAIKSYEYGKKAKDELLKYLFYFLSVAALVIIFIFLFGNPLTGSSGIYQDVSFAAKNSGPLTGSQWQNAMAWVRDSTPADSVFLHWWDYGYLVQTLGKRTTIVDGGNANVYWDHLLGRYVLTTPQPETALSFMKAHNVSYLLIDPTDFGKYPAYSSIGSDSNGEDRFAQIPVMAVDSSQTIESADKEMRIYQGAAPVDEDVVFSDENGSIFLPSGRAYIIGMVVEISKNAGSFTLKQPIAVFIYNNQQIRIPMRYVYYKGDILDFGNGIEATARITQAFTLTSNGGVSADNLGLVIYLSPKVSKGLFSQLYLMDDPKDKYSTVTLAHSEPDVFVSQIRAQGIDTDDIIFFQGLRGPIKIWEIKYPNNIIARDEFLRISG